MKNRVPSQISLFLFLSFIVFNVSAQTHSDCFNAIRVNKDQVIEIDIDSFLIKNNLDEMLDTLFSTAKVKNSVSSRLKKSIKNGYFSDSEGKEIRNEVMEAHYKYMAFGETLSRTTYSNKQLINDYHNSIYRIIEKIDSATLKSE